jgi:hypothetical protein
MNIFKYQISDKPDQEIWVCEACKKGNNKLILTGKWKLIDKCSDDGIPCAICQKNEVVVVPVGAISPKRNLTCGNDTPIFSKKNKTRQQGRPR